MHNALKFFLAGCVAEIYLLVIRRFYVNGTANELLACDAALPYLMGIRTKDGMPVLYAGV